MCENNGNITTGISLDIDLYNDMEKLRSLDKTSRSRFVQIALRLHIIRIKKMKLQDIADSLNAHEKKELLKILNY